MSIAAISRPPDQPHLKLLGSFDLRYHGRPVAVPPVGQRLLSLLVLSRRALPRDYVADKLWPDAPGTRGGSCLRSALCRLPRLDRPLVSATPSTIGLSADINTDVASAETALRQVISRAERPLPDPDRFALPEVELADRALSSDLLPEAWDEWVVVERERLRQLRLHALESLSSAHRAAGHYGQALDAALLAVAAEPLRESAHRHVIETHLAEGNTGEAIRHFTQLRRLFETELGLPPSLMLRRTMGAVRARQCHGRDA